MNSLSDYLIRFQNLRRDNAHGAAAPHKPILLLSVLYQFHRKEISENKIYITPELVATFRTFWNKLVSSNHECKFSLPFTYLTSDGFWHLQPRSGFENIIVLKSSLRSFSNLNAAIECAYLDNELAELMMDLYSNSIITHSLLDKYFPETKENFTTSENDQMVFIDNVEKEILFANSDDYKMEVKQLIAQRNDEEIFIRGSLFKREIPKIYQNTCCISGMRVDSVSSISMVDACHIIPFAKSYDDTISNGIALCPNLHRAFDRGLISIDDNYQVLISRLFREDNSNYSIGSFEKQQIMLPVEERFFPGLSNLKWHRENIFNRI
jgi:putative restriction endonuclease